MRRSLVTILALVTAALTGAPPARGQDLGALQPPAHAGPFDRLPSTVPLPRADAPPAGVTGLRATVPPFPPTRVAQRPVVLDRSRHFSLPGDPIAVHASGAVRVRLLRVTRTGRPMRGVTARTLRAGRRTTITVPAQRGAHHELRLTAGSRTRRLFLYTPAGGAARAFLARPAFRAGDELTGELVVTGDAALTGGACGDLEQLRDGRWVPAETQDRRACILVLVVLNPGERFTLGYGRLPDDLAPGRFRYVRRLTTQLDGRRADATAEFDVVR